MEKWRHPSSGGLWNFASELIWEFGRLTCSGDLRRGVHRPLGLTFLPFLFSFVTDLTGRTCFNWYNSCSIPNYRASAVTPSNNFGKKAFKRKKKKKKAFKRIDFDNMKKFEWLHANRDSKFHFQSKIATGILRYGSGGLHEQRHQAIVPKL